MLATRSSRVRPAALAAGAALAILVAAAIVGLSGRASRHQPALAPGLDLGTSLSAPAPDFTLTDQFGRPVSLHTFRGRVVVLAFNDSQCTTVCPLTTTAMVNAQRMLGAAGAGVSLLGIDANPAATSVGDVLAYSEAHGLTRQWQFLTGSPAQLRQVWRAYHIDVAIENDQVDHTPALFVIDRRGHLAKLYLTPMAYSSVDQQALLLAREVARLLPGHPAVHANLSLAQIPTIGPAQPASLPRAGGGTVALGPGRARLLAFFDTWDSEVTDLRGQLLALSGYSSATASQGLPPLTAVDEASVEPSPGALPRFLASLGHPLSYPVAVDGSGRVADGYEVQDEPWLVLVSASGQILWYYDVSTSGWLKADALAKQVRAALERVKTPSSPAAVRALLAGSPPALAALHGQAGQLLSGSVTTRLRALRGYPAVINAWASWCGPCRSEFGLFASASARFGRRVAFLGADTNDSAGDARAFLTRHPVSYPSYPAANGGLRSLAVVEGLPTTIFVDRAGKVVYVHTGQYEAQGTLDEDISSYLLSGSGG